MVKKISNLNLIFLHFYFRDFLIINFFQYFMTHFNYHQQYFKFLDCLLFLHLIYFLIFAFLHSNLLFLNFIIILLLFNFFSLPHFLNFILICLIHFQYFLVPTAIMIHYQFFNMNFLMMNHYHLLN